MKIRKYQTEDLKEIIALFKDSVINVSSKDYSKKQINAWIRGVDEAKWNESLLVHDSVVVKLNGVIVGFGDMDGNYLDRLYVHKDYQRQKIASMICDVLEKRVSQNVIWVHASITAKPFFEKRGYHVVKENFVVRNQVTLMNYLMEKELSND